MKKVAIKLIDIYKAATASRPPSCRYYPSCSTYAKDAYQTLNFFKATRLTIWRMIRCNPFSKGGFDPVPPPRKSKKQKPYSNIKKEDQ